MIGTASPEVLAVDQEVESAIASSDCRRTQGALNRLAKLAGVATDE
jgi:hypothetical protein